jgi:hypothetical protein
MIEVVLASVLMAMIASTLVSGLGYVHAAHRRQERQLGAAEMANRIMLQYLDDKDALPSDALPIAYGARGELRYYWKVDKDKIELRLDRAGAKSQTGRTSGIDLKNLLEMVTVRIWYEHIPNVNPSLSGNPPDFMLKRIVNNMAVRNPDSIMKQFSTPDGMLRFLEQFQQLQGGG